MTAHADNQGAQPTVGEAAEGGTDESAPKDEPAGADGRVEEPEDTSPEPANAESPDDPQAAEPPAGEAGAAGTGGDTPTDQLPEKAAEYLALAQRTQADFENYRKRVARDNALALDRGVRRLAAELFPALDHLDAALQAIDDPEVVKGVRLVQDEFTAALRRVGIEPFSPEGETFDPNEHEAMAQQPAEGTPAGQVISVYQQGYRHNGQLIRPARVVVAA